MYHLDTLVNFILSYFANYLHKKEKYLAILLRKKTAFLLMYHVDTIEIWDIPVIANVSL